VTDRQAIAAALDIAHSTDNPAVAAVLVRGAELLAEKAASERFNRRLIVAGIAVAAAAVGILLRELAGLV
jgi:pyrimidine deaminase RibD-like protein